MGFSRKVRPGSESDLPRVKPTFSVQSLNFKHVKTALDFEEGAPQLAGLSCVGRACKRVAPASPPTFPIKTATRKVLPGQVRIRPPHHRAFDGAQPDSNQGR